MSSNASELDIHVKAGYNPEVAAGRTPDYPVSPIILNRWSPRSYADRPLTDEQLFTVLEAARWSPSGGNQQPWRFYIARTEAELAEFRKFIKPRNRLWSDKAPVLLLIASEKFRENGAPNGVHAFDTGAAWAALAFQAGLLGLSTRAIGGFDQELAREVLQTPEHIALHVVIALGYRGDAETLEETFREAEKPNGRRPLAESILPVNVNGSRTEIQEE
ncbi:nitroreductase family protein [Paenibacillus sp. S150]|uniref:nitroreductase family protein n=1 Tax=Paenibacillus sp. S150 TaxID=2749826 RepID=UPI001C55C4FF|nr:nitroreductase family protein [Paenibacillus sp. S150]MBW4079820.1 nitroreductase family protein [Paenibacillus sp. S150]